MQSPFSRFTKGARRRLAIGVLLVFVAGQSHSGELCKIVGSPWGAGKTVAFSSTPYELSDKGVGKKKNSWGGYEKDAVVELSCVEGVKVFDAGTSRERSQKSGLWYLTVPGLQYTDAADTENHGKGLDPAGKGNQFEFSGQDMVRPFNSKEDCEKYKVPYKDFTAADKDASVLFLLQVAGGKKNYHSYFYPASCHSFIKVFEQALAAGHSKTAYEYVKVLQAQAKESDTAPIVKPIKGVEKGKLAY